MAHGASSPDASPPAARGRTGDSAWWEVPNFGSLVIWWVVVMGYYLVFTSISGRYHDRVIDPEMLTQGWYAILISGVIGAFYAKRFRPLWFLISVVLAALILLVMLLGLGGLQDLMNS